MGYTISCSQGHIAEAHDKRDYYPDNADKNLQADNKTLISTEDDKTAFREFFQDSVDDYNAKQKRNDRKKTDYYDEIANGDGKEHPFYEYVVQIGNHETNGTLDRSAEAMKCREALDKAMEKLPEKYPDFKFVFIGSHGDEPNGTYHYHVRFIPVGTGYKNGMETRCSLNKSLENMGFKSKGKPYPIDLWKQDVEHLVEEEMLQQGLTRDYKNEHRRRQDVSDYIRTKMQEDTERLYEQAGATFQDANDEYDRAIKTHSKVKAKEKDLDTRESDLKARERVLREQEAKSIEEKQNNLLKAQELAEREKALAKREEEKEAEFQRREDALASQEQALASAIEGVKKLPSFDTDNIYITQKGKEGKFSKPVLYSEYKANHEKLLQRTRSLMSDVEAMSNRQIDDWQRQ